MTQATITWLGILILFFAVMAFLFYLGTQKELGKRIARQYALRTFLIWSSLITLQELLGIPLILPLMSLGCLMLSIFGWLVWPRQHGQRLLALVKPSDAVVFSMVAIGLWLFAITGIVLIWQSPTRQTDLWLRGPTVLFFFAAGLPWLQVGQRFADLFEHGFYNFGWFTPWSQVVSYRWDAAKPEKLFFRLKPNFIWPGPRKIGLRVAPEMIAQAQQILDEKLPDRQRNFDDAEPNDAIDAT